MDSLIYGNGGMGGQRGGVTRGNKDQMREMPDGTVPGNAGEMPDGTAPGRGGQMGGQPEEAAPEWN